jgi:uncharacterized protein DUF5063
MRDPIQSFATVAADYCSWAEAKPRDAATEAAFARRSVAELYRLALDLPNRFCQTNALEISHEDWKTVHTRFGALPFNYYSACFNPLVVPAEEPVAGDLADDLADIWRDLKPGVVLFEERQVEASAYHWRFNFDVHWARHAIGALYALQAWFSLAAGIPEETS